jgi:methyl-accepting chemotaxis protein
MSMNLANPDVALIRLLGLGRGADALPVSLVRAQLKAAREPYPITFAGTVLVGAIVALTAPRPAIVWPPALMLLMVSVWSLMRWHQQKRNDWLVTDARDTVVTIALLSFVTAAAWGLMLYAALIGSSEDGRILLTCAITGVMSVGALTVATLPLASVAFLTGAMVVVVPTIHLVHLPATVFGMLCVFFALLARSVVAQARLFSQHFYTGQHLTEASRERAALEDAARTERERAELAEARAQQAQRERAIEGRRSEMVTLAERFEASVGEAVAGLALAARETRNSADTLAATSAAQADDIEAIASVAARTSGAADRMHATAGALSGIAAEVADQVTRQVCLTNEAMGEARSSASVIAKLTEDAAQVGQVVAMISGIADQTNLLALNATIEAARAGDAGRGFTIVANEVKSLANQTREATKGVEQQIATMQQRVSAVAQVMDGILAQVEHVSSVAADIRAAVDDQTSVAASITDSAQGTATDSAHLHAGVDNVAHASEQGRRLAADMAQATALVAGQAETLAISAKSFLAELRAA